MTGGSLERWRAHGYAPLRVRGVMIYGGHAHERAPRGALLLGFVVSRQPPTRGKAEDYASIILLISAVIALNSFLTPPAMNGSMSLMTPPIFMVTSMSSCDCLALRGLTA